MNVDVKAARDRARFDAFVEKTSGDDSCWTWIGSRDRDGYGFFYLNGKHRRAHRVAYEFAYGALDAEVVRHNCDNPSCVRPSHLLPGTQKENLRDAYSRGRKCDVGEANCAAKMTAAKVVEMRELHATGRYTQTRLAAMFGINQTVVSDIIRRKSWRHV